MIGESGRGAIKTWASAKKKKKKKKVEAGTLRKTLVRRPRAVLLLVCVVRVSLLVRALCCVNCAPNAPYAGLARAPNFSGVR